MIHTLKCCIGHSRQAEKYNRNSTNLKQHCRNCIILRKIQQIQDRFAKCNKCCCAWNRNDHIKSADQINLIMYFFTASCLNRSHKTWHKGCRQCTCNTQRNIGDRIILSAEHTKKFSVFFFRHSLRCHSICKYRLI